MLCPDGCGDVLTINLDKRSGKAWRTDRRHGGLTVYPSVWRDSGCGAHFIVWRDQILWCDWWESPDPADVRLTARVMQEIALHGAEYVHYEVVATAIDENPWDVHWACNVLTRRGDVEVRERVSYRKRTPRPAGIERSA
jgi:hypothetical protein